jgi:hypothetical protein
MTVADLIRDYVPRLKEFFPEQVQMEWSLDEYLRSGKRVRDRALARLDRWRKERRANSHCGASTGSP